MTKGLCEVPQAKWTFKSRSHRGEKAEFHLRHNGGKSFILQEYNAVLYAAGVTIFIYFECCDGKGEEGVTKGSTEDAVLCFGNIFPCFGVVMETIIILSVGLVSQSLVSVSHRGMSREVTRGDVRSDG